MTAIVVCKPNALFRDPVDVRSFDPFLSVAPQFRVSQIVCHDQHDVWRLLVGAEGGRHNEQASSQKEQYLFHRSFFGEMVNVYEADVSFLQHMRPKVNLESSESWLFPVNWPFDRLAREVQHV